MPRSLGPARRLIPLFVAACCAPVRAEQFTWTGLSTTSSNWTDAANWSPGRAPPNNGTADLVFHMTPRLDPTHGAWSVHRLVFDSTSGSIDVQSNGPLTFANDPAHQFYPQPVLANDSDRPNAVRGNIVLPLGASLQARAGRGPLTLGNVTGSRLNGGGGTRGGRLLLNSYTDGLVFMLDNAATSAADRGLYLTAIDDYVDNAPDPVDGPTYQAHLTIVPADANYAGTGSSIDVTNLFENVRLRFKPEGADRNSVGFAPTRIGLLYVYGDERAAGVARAGAAAPRVVFNGLTQNGTINTWGNVTVTGGDDALYTVDGLSGGIVRVQGTATFGSAHTDASRTLRFTNRIEVVPAPNPAAVVFDPTLGATGDVTNRRTEYTGTVTLRPLSNQLASLVFRSSAHVTNGPAMTFDGTIDGSGIVRLEEGSADIAFTPATRIVVGAFDDPGDLRFEGTGPNLAHFATPARLSAINGSGSVEFRRTDNQPYDYAGNVWPVPLVNLKVTDSNPTGLDARLNAAGGTSFTGGVTLEAGSTFDVAGNRLRAVGGLGTLIGPATYGFVNPGLDFQVGTLTITGDTASLDTLSIRTRFSDGPQAYGRLHATGDLSLVNAEGAPTRLSAFPEGEYLQQLTIVSLDAGATLTGQFEGLPDGAHIRSLFGTAEFIIHYNVDGGDGSANDIVLTVVPEPATPALLLGATALLLRPRKRQ